jgi:hypothetical protein
MKNAELIATAPAPHNPEKNTVTGSACAIIREIVAKRNNISAPEIRALLDRNGMAAISDATITTQRALARKKLGISGGSGGKYSIDLSDI